MRKTWTTYLMVMFTIVMTGCNLMNKMNLPPGSPCEDNSWCGSGSCIAKQCAGLADGNDCTIPAACSSRQCTNGKCVPQQCRPECSGEEVCADGKNCIPWAGRTVGQDCYGYDTLCLSRICDPRTKTCAGRQDGAYCIQDENCAYGHKCINLACQAIWVNPTPTTYACFGTTSCGVGQVCTSASPANVCSNLLLAIGQACVMDSNCVTNYCDPVMDSTCQVRPGTCTPSCSGFNAGSVACGTRVSDGCSGFCGTGTMCSAGSTCNGTACVPNAIDGAALYASSCQSCHGPLASSSKLGRTATQIQNAINANTGGMGALSSLTSAQVSAIATALATSNFTVSAPASFSAAQGGSGSINITVSTTDNTSKTVALTVSGAPAGVTATLAPSSVTVSSASSQNSVLSVTVASTASVGNYTLTITGTSGADTRTATTSLSVTASGGSGLPNGSTCTADTDCGSGHCGPTLSATKLCLGKVDYKGTAAVATECWSGVFIAGTTTCGPAQFKACATSSAYNTFQFWSSTGAGTRTAQVTGTGRCVLSDPSKDETSATESGDYVCFQYTDWAKAGVACNNLTGSTKQAVWNTGRDYNKPLGVALMAAALMDDYSVQFDVKSPAWLVQAEKPYWQILAELYDPVVFATTPAHFNDVSR